MNLGDLLLHNYDDCDDCFNTECDVVGEDSTVHVFEDNITDCGVNDDQEMIEELD